MNLIELQMDQINFNTYCILEDITVHKHTEGHKLTYPAIGLPVLDSTIHAEAYARVDSLLLHLSGYG